MENKIGFKGWKAAPFVFATEACQTMVTATLALNLFTYAFQYLHYPYTEASKVLTNFSGTAALLTLLGGFLSDVYISQLTAIFIGQALGFIGATLLTVTAVVKSLRPPSCVPGVSPCLEPTGPQKSVFFLGLYMLAVGLAFMRPNNPTLGAAQFDEQNPRQGKQLQSYFNWFFFWACVGGVPAVTFISYILENYSVAWGFGLPAATLVFSIFTICGGMPYRPKERTESVFTRILQVIVAATRNWKLEVPSAEFLYEESDKEFALPHTSQFRFLDRAAIKPDADESRTSHWKLCTVTQVEELKAITRILPIFASTIMLSCVLAQLQTFTLAQANLLDRKITKNFKMPLASLATFPFVAILILLPVYDKILVPFLRKLTGHERGITHLQRLGIGLVLCTLSMFVAALVEMKRLTVARRHGYVNGVLPMSAFWMALQFLVFGIADMFTIASLLDFFYTECPVNMRTMGLSLINVSNSFGYFLSTIIVSLVNKCTDPDWLPLNLTAARLDKFYWLLGVLSAINFANYLYWSWWR